MANTTQKSDGSKKMNAIEMLIDDHKKVKKLFKEFDKLKESQGEEEKKAELVEQICLELTIHTLLEEEIFYPAARQVLEEEDMIEEAEVEHASAKDLISQLLGMQPGDEHYDAIVTVLGEQIDHHVKEEEDEMFPELKKAKLDVATLGEQMAARKDELGTDLNLMPVGKPGQKAARGHQPRA